MKMVAKLELTFALATMLCIGAAAGFYAGKSQTLERVVEKKLELKISTSSPMPPKPKEK